MIDSYREIPYPSLAHRRTHPGRIAAMARLFGATPADPRRARILELGCGDGTNLAAMAVTLPEATLVGIDRSPDQIAQGRKMLVEAGIAHANLHCADLRALDGTLGEFDYVIAHGLFSWIPADVQEILLSVAHRHLDERGVALVSYNTYPGWRTRGVVRDLMQHQVATGGRSALEAVRATRTLLKFLAEKATPGHYGDLLAAEAKRLGESRDDYLVHDYLEADNHPSHFIEFVGRAERAGLRYLADSSLAVMPQAAGDAEILAAADDFAQGNPLGVEQFLDFVANRNFRSSLLVRAESSRAPILDPTRIGDLFATTRLRPARAAAENEVQAFVLPDGTGIQLGPGIERLVLQQLASAWPAGIPVSAAVDTAAGLTGTDLSAALSRTAGFLLQMLAHEFIDLAATPWTCATRVDDRPATSPLARWLAANQRPIATLHHESLELNDYARTLLVLLDGQRTRDDIVRLLAGRSDADELGLGELGQLDDDLLMLGDTALLLDAVSAGPYLIAGQPRR